ncbi:MAG: SGNH/GDSL hydrolase family protein [bacterium]|nr:SGNH/GDSL hydrolase family protein [bacterium]
MREQDTTPGVDRSPWARSLRRSVGPKLLLAALSLLSSLLLLDLAARVLFRRELDPDLIAERNAATNFGAFTRPSEVPGLVYELSSGVRLRWNELEAIAISELGPYRVDEAGERPVPERALRIAVLGDSTSFGWRVPFEVSYPEVLRRSLEEHLGVPVAVRNYSVPGYNSEQERLVCERWALPSQPDLLILHYDHNDWEPAIREKPASYLDPAYGDNPLRSALVRLLLRRVRIAREIERRETPLAREHRLLGDYALEGPLYDRHLEQLGRIADQAARRGIPAVAVIFDAFLQSEQRPLEGEHYRLLHGRLIPALVDRGFEVLDLFHPYQRLMAEQGWKDLSRLWVATDDAHPNEIGHELIAQGLEQFILGNNLLASREGPSREATRRPTSS